MRFWAKNQENLLLLGLRASDRFLSAWENQSDSPISNWTLLSSTNKKWQRDKIYKHDGLCYMFSFLLKIIDRF